MSNEPAPSAATPKAVYIDPEGDVWFGNTDGTLSLMEPVGEDDRYSRWPMDKVVGMFGADLRRVDRDA